MTELDPFDLPDWVGEGPVTWSTDDGLSGHLVTGGLTGPAGETLPCDLLAADVAYPRPLLGEQWRHDAHQAWEHGQVLLVGYDGRLTLAVPGTAYSADGVLETLGRLARAIGADPERFTVLLRL